MLLLLFGAILAAGASQAGLPAALLSGAADWGALEPAVPIIFLALVYHDLIPVIVSYLGGDRAAIRWVGLARRGAAILFVGRRRRRQPHAQPGAWRGWPARECRSALMWFVLSFCPHACRSAICLGSLVPLAMFLSWEAVALSLLPAGLGESAAAAAVGGAPLMQASLQLAAADAGATLPAAAAAGVDAAAAAMPVAELADGPAALAVDPLQVRSGFGRVFGTGTQAADWPGLCDAPHRGLCNS